MYEWLDKEFQQLTTQIKEIHKKREINQQKRNALMRKYYETKVIDKEAREEVIKETEMLSDASRLLFAKRYAINSMLKAYYGENRLLRK